MRIKATGLILLSFLLLLGTPFVYGEEPKQEYVVIDLSKCTMEPCPMDKSKKWLEKVWVVHPQIVITTPKEYSQMEDMYDGTYKGVVVEYLAQNRKTNTKVYTSETKLELSKNIPPEIMRVYQDMVIYFVNIAIERSNEKIRRSTVPEAIA